MDEIISTLPMTGESVGIDVGINRLATLSNKEHVPNPRYTNKLAKKLARYQKALSRKEINSNRWIRQKHEVTKIQAKIAGKFASNVACSSGACKLNVA
ncbi:MAG: transposase [Candidatus Portnoybacteria bacterium]|nr:transposase [Candidatus Portnoybacteria bacterium]